MNRVVLSVVLAALLPASSLQAAFSFTPGHYYSSTQGSGAVTQYNADGVMVGVIGLGTDVRGIEFGPNGMLYAVVTRQNGFYVYAVDASGETVGSYGTTAVYIGGNLSYGEIAVDDTYIYVAGGRKLTRFEIANPASTKIIYDNNQVFDVKTLPSGNLLVASAYDVEEITPNGGFVRKLSPSTSFTDIRGVAFDPKTNNAFAWHHGTSASSNRLMRFDWATGVLEASFGGVFADDLFITSQGHLLVGSGTWTPRLYTQNLELMSSFGVRPQRFITQFPLPEPASATLFLMAAVTLRRRGRRKAT